MYTSTEHQESLADACSLATIYYRPIIFLHLRIDVTDSRVCIANKSISLTSESKACYEFTEICNHGASTPGDYVVGR